MRRRVDSIITELSGGPIDYDDQQYLVDQFAKQTGESYVKYRRYFTILLAVEVPIIGYVAKNPYLRLLALLSVLLTAFLTNAIFPRWRSSFYAANFAGCFLFVYLAWCMGVQSLWILLPVINMATVVMMESANGNVVEEIDRLREKTYKLKTA